MQVAHAAAVRERFKHGGRSKNMENVYAARSGSSSVIFIWFSSAAAANRVAASDV